MDIPLTLPPPPPPPPSSILLQCKWGKRKIIIPVTPDLITIYDLKLHIQTQTNVLPKRQKLIGLALATSKSQPTDETLLSSIKLKPFILMGTPEAEIIVDPSDMHSLPEIVDDFDHSFNAGSEEWVRMVQNGANLKEFTAKTDVFIMNPPRRNRPLLVCDLDHCLLDFSSKDTSSSATEKMKRPFLTEFLTNAYRHYDIAVWSQTSWRWVEIKLTELNFLNNPNFVISFCLDKSSMFKVTSDKNDGSSYDHYVKPLQLIWTKFPHIYGPHNTVHIDDLTKNFALNSNNGITVTPFYRKKSKNDIELKILSVYLQKLAESYTDFSSLDHKNWRSIAIGEKKFSPNPPNDDTKKPPP